MSLKFKVNGIVLAAGLGTRLRPITGSIPKPMVSVCNRPLLENILTNMERSGVDRIAVNTHYIADKVHDYIKGSPYSENVVIFHEDEILGTGGPLVNAKGVLSESEYFVLHNGDILTDLEISSLVKAHEESGNVVTMVMIDGPENKVLVDENGTVLDIVGKLGVDNSFGELYTYAGISVYSKEIFDYLPKTPQNYSIITAILDLMSDRVGSVGTFIPEDIYWNDLGTIKQYYKAHQDILRDSKLALPNFELNQCLPPKSDQFKGFVSYGQNVSVGDDAIVVDCVLLDGAKVLDGEFHRKEIIGADFTVHADIEMLREIDIVDDIDSYKISSMVEQGSNRQFYRLEKDGESQVLMVSNKDDQDFQRFIDMSELLCATGIPVPFIHSISYTKFAVLMDDMGTETLYDKVNNLSNIAKVEKLYKQVIQQSVLIHTLVLEKNKLFNFRIRDFDYYYLRWETEYFSQNFLKRYCGLSQPMLDMLSPFFDQLANIVLEQPQVFMHRDLQSQNIVFKNEKVGFVDFQGARIGAIGYDAMSLINDPYVSLPKDLRDNLKKYYFKLFNGFGFDFSEEEFNLTLVTAGLQRSMQALGAYTFLSLEKGKKEYLKYIPRCYEYLLEGIEDLLIIDANSKVELLRTTLKSINNELIETT